MSTWNDGIETPYTAVYMIFKKGNRIAFILRSHTGWMDGNYGLPAGRVDKGEPFTIAAMREAFEEVGATIQAKDLKPVLLAHRKDSDSVWVDLVFEVQKWVGELFNAEPDKHGELVWLDPDQLPDNIVPSVRFYVDQYLAGNTYAEYGWH